MERTADKQLCCKTVNISNIAIITSMTEVLWSWWWSWSWQKYYHDDHDDVYDDDHDDVYDDDHDDYSDDFTLTIIMMILEIFWTLLLWLVGKNDIADDHYCSDGDHFTRKHDFHTMLFKFVATFLL